MRVARFTAIRISSVPQLPQKNRCQNSIMGQSYGPRRIFFHIQFIIFPEYGHIQGKTQCRGPRRQPCRQAHGGTALARRHHERCPWDFLGLVNASRTSLVPCAKQRALIGVSSSRSSRVSRGVRSAGSICTVLSLVSDTYCDLSALRSLEQQRTGAAGHLCNLLNLVLEYCNLG